MARPALVEITASRTVILETETREHRPARFLEFVSRTVFSRSQARAFDICSHRHQPNSCAYKGETYLALTPILERCWFERSENGFESDHCPLPPKRVTPRENEREGSRVAATLDNQDVLVT
jgi:hypothetical protein